MCNEILYTDENTCIEYFYSKNKNIKKIAFVFSPSMNRELTGFGFGGSFLLNNGFDLIAFKLIDDSWFQNVPNRILNDINKIVGLRNYEKRIGCAIDAILKSDYPNIYFIVINICRYI